MDKKLKLYVDNGIFSSRNTWYIYIDNQSDNTDFTSTPIVKDEVSCLLFMDSYEARQEAINAMNEIIKRVG